MGLNTQRRSAGRYRNERKRAKKRIDIRAGRAISMREAMHNTHHHEEDTSTFQQEETTTAVMVPGNVMEDPMPLQEGTHVLVRKDISLVDGSPVEAEIFRGTEGQMRGKRTKMMQLDAAIVAEGGTASTYSVRKVK